MMWDEWGNDFGHEYEEEQQQQQEEEEDSYLKFDFLSVLSKPKDYYRILEVDYDATEEVIRSNFIRLALSLLNPLYSQPFGHYNTQPLNMQGSQPQQPQAPQVQGSQNQKLHYNS